MLRTTALTTSSNDVPQLVDDIVAPDREVPIVVMAMAYGQTLSDVTRRAALTAETLAGVADVRLLVSQAVPAFNEAMGDEMAVFQGAVRTYLPGASVGDPRSYRHRYVTRTRADRHERAAAHTLARELFARASSARPPLLYREHVHGLLRSGGDVAAWDIATELDAELAEVRGQLDQASEDLELERLEHDETLADLESARSRVRYLERELADAGRPQFDVETPEEAIPRSAETCEEVAVLVGQHLEFVELPASACIQVAYLDGFPDASKWAKKAWMAFRALDAYGRAKAEGRVDADFRGANVSGALKTFAIPGSQVTMHESETTNSNAG